MTAYGRKITIAALLFPIMVAVVLRATLHPIPTADLWWYLATGRFITATWSFPVENFFSYTAPHYPMVDHEWIPELLFYVLYRGGGFPWLYVLKSLMILSAVLVLFASALRRRAHHGAALLAVIVAVSCAKGNLYCDIRPYIFSYLFMALFYFILNDYLERGTAKSLVMLPFITWLWVNCHGAFILAFLIYSLFLVSLVLEYGYCRLSRSAYQASGLAGPVIIAMCASLGLAFINPYGITLLLYPLSFLGHSYYKSHLIEWIGPNLLGRDLPFLIFFLAVTIVLLIYRRRFRLFDILSYVLFSYLALTTVRHITLYCLFVIPLCAVLMQEVAMSPLLRPLREAAARFFRQELFRTGAGIVMLLLFLVLSFMSFRAVDYAHLSMEDALFPRYGMAFLARNRIRGPLFNPYEWGGYMLWHLYPSHTVFIDGRANTSYPEEVYRESLIAMFGEEGWKEILDKYRINAVLCNKFHMETDSRYRLAAKLTESGAWAEIYQDRAEVLFVRISEENRELIERACRGTLEIPDSPFSRRKAALAMMEKGKFGEAAVLLDAALAMDDSFLQLYVDRAYTALRTGDRAEAERLLREVLRRDDSLYHAHDLLGRIYEEAGDIAKARKEYRKALKINPDFTFSRDALYRLERGK